MARTKQAFVGNPRGFFTKDIVLHGVANAYVEVTNIPIGMNIMEITGLQGELQSMTRFSIAINEENMWTFPGYFLTEVSDKSADGKTIYFPQYLMYQYIAQNAIPLELVRTVRLYVESPKRDLPFQALIRFRSCPELPERIGEQRYLIKNMNKENEAHVQFSDTAIIVNPSMAGTDVFIHSDTCLGETMIMTLDAPGGAIERELKLQRITDNMYRASVAGLEREFWNSPDELTGYVNISQAHSIMFTFDRRLSRATVCFLTINAFCVQSQFRLTGKSFIN